MIYLVYVLPLVLVLAWHLRKREHLQAESVVAKAEAEEAGLTEPASLHPLIDPLKCIGCGSCVRACPEDGVLDLLHGQAVVVHGARCVGHGRCAEACPTSAIALTFAD